jgi:hypothetical protein
VVRKFSLQLCKFRFSTPDINTTSDAGRRRGLNGTVTARDITGSIVIRYLIILWFNGDFVDMR